MPNSTGRISTTGWAPAAPVLLWRRSLDEGIPIAVVSPPFIPFIGVLVYLFFSVMRPQDWWGPLLLKPVDYYVFGYIFLTGAITSGFTWIANSLASQQSKLIALYFVWALFTIVANGASDTFMPQATILLSLFLVFLAFASFARTTTRVEVVLLGFVVLGAVLSYQGHVLKETGVGWAGQELYWGERIRWIGMYDGANVLCMLFAMSLGFSVCLLLGPWSLVTKLVCLAAAPMTLYGVYLTNSRGGFLAVVVSVAMAIMLRRTDKQINLRRAIPAACVAMLLLTAGPSRMDSINDADKSAAGRVDAWQEGLEMLRYEPFVGVGYGQWLKHHRRLAHNAIVQSMGELGFIGLVSWFAVHFGLVKGLLRLRSSPEPRERSAATALLVGLGAFYSCSFFVTTTQFDHTYIFSGLTVGLLGTQGAPRLDRKDAMWILAAVFVAITVIYVTVRVFYATA